MLPGSTLDEPTPFYKEANNMTMPKDMYQNNLQEGIIESRRLFIENLEESIEKLEKGIEEAEVMVDICTPEWCRATENMMDELLNRIYSISEPDWSSVQDSHKLKLLKRRLHDVYTKYKKLPKS
jgi:hypothetical protein